jgi:hypothetical protein
MPENQRRASRAGRTLISTPSSCTHARGASGVEAALWCAVASDAVWHCDGKKLKSSGLEYAHGGGHQHWLAGIRDFLRRTHRSPHRLSTRASEAIPVGELILLRQGRVIEPTDFKTNFRNRWPRHDV